MSWLRSTSVDFPFYPKGQPPSVLNLKCFHAIVSRGFVQCRLVDELRRWPSADQIGHSLPSRKIGGSLYDVITSYLAGEGKTEVACRREKRPEDDDSPSRDSGLSLGCGGRCFQV